MTKYKRCDGREKSEGRHVYKGTRAGGNKVYCWHNGGRWRFSERNNARMHSTGACDLCVVDEAVSPEKIKSASMWGAWVNGKWEGVTGMNVQGLSVKSTSTRNADINGAEPNNDDSADIKTDSADSDGGLLSEAKHGSGAPNKTCPNGHTLTRFSTPLSSFFCDGCGESGLAEGSTMYGCHACNHDLCSCCEGQPVLDNNGHRMEWSDYSEGWYDKRLAVRYVWRTWLG